MIPPGQVLARRYRVERLLAHGGMAEVYLGTDEHAHGQVALKLLHPHFAADPAFVQRFRTEATTAVRLVHPNIVRCLDFGVDAGQPFLIMEYVAGETLADLLAREHHLPPGHTLAIVRSVLAALAYVHERGLVHRDVKPANVLVAQDGIVKLTDFGIAQALAAAALTRTGQVLGSVHYVAPERLMGVRATPASDCYAVGILLYRMLTGRLPFEGDNVAGILAQQLHQSPPLPSSARPGLPAWLDQVVLHALAKEPAERYPSAANLLAALDSEPTAPLSATALHAAIRAAPMPPDSAATQHEGYQAIHGPSPHPRPLERTTRFASPAPFDSPAQAVRPRWRAPALSGGAAVLVGLALFLLAFGSQAGSWTAERAAQPTATNSASMAVASTPQPTPTSFAPVMATSIAPSTRPPSSPLLAAPLQSAPPLQGAVAEVRSLLQEALATGRVTRKRNELQETLGKLERQIPAGEYKEAREQAHKLAETVRELTGDNQLDRGIATRLLARLTALQDQLDALAPGPAREAGRRQ